MKESTKKLLEHVFITMPTMMGVAYFVLWACAPPAALPPPVPMTGSPTMQPQGAGLSSGKTPRTVTGEIGVGAMSGIDAVSFEGGGWSWLSAHIDNPRSSVDLGLVASGQLILGEGSAAGGGYLRVMKKRPDSQVGFELSGGMLWARVAVPYMKQYGEHSWLYTSPGVTASPAPDIQLPLGVAIETGRLGVVRLETGMAVRIDSFNSSFTPAFYLAFSGSLRFGKAMRGSKKLTPDEAPIEPPLPSIQLDPKLTLPDCVSCTLTPSTQPVSAPSSAPTSMP